MESLPAVLHVVCCIDSRIRLLLHHTVDIDDIRRKMKSSHTSAETLRVSGMSKPIPSLGELELSLCAWSGVSSRAWSAG